MQQAATDSIDHGLRAVIGMKPGQNHADVALDRGLGDAELGGNFLVGLALGDE